MKIMIPGIFLMLCLSAHAQVPLIPVQKACATGVSSSEVIVTRIPANEISVEENFRGDMTATYSLFEEREIGYAKGASGPIFIIYGKSMYPVDMPIPIGISMKEYKDGLGRGDFEFDQIADWSLVSHRGKRFLCVALSQPMEQARTYMYLLDLKSKPRRLYFSGISKNTSKKNGK